MDQGAWRATVHGTSKSQTQRATEQVRRIRRDPLTLSPVVPGPAQATSLACTSGSSSVKWDNNSYLRRIVRRDHRAHGRNTINGWDGSHSGAATFQGRRAEDPGGGPQGRGSHIAELEDGCHAQPPLPSTPSVFWSTCNGGIGCRPSHRASGARTRRWLPGRGSISGSLRESAGGWGSRPLRGEHS